MKEEKKGITKKKKKENKQTKKNNITKLIMRFLVLLGRSLLMSIILQFCSDTRGTFVLIPGELCKLYKTVTHELDMKKRKAENNVKPRINIEISKPLKTQHKQNS